jgi:hypothetical protein
VRHVYLPADTPEPSAEHIAEREAEWLDAIQAGDFEATQRRLGDVEWSDEIRVDGLAICVSYRTAKKAAQAMGARLPTYEEAVAMFRAARHVEPRKVTRREGPMAYQTSASDLAIQLHSEAVDDLPDELVDNRGKLWLAGAPNGRARNFGWVDPAAPYRLAPGLRGWQSPGTRHTDGHVDCSQTLRVVRDVRANTEWPWDDATLALGERLLAWLGHQFGLDPREIPGDQHEPLILGYSEHCRRGGTFLGVDAYGEPRWDGGAPLPLWTDELAWCAAYQSAALHAALLPGEEPPHGLRVSVRELVEDARKAGTLESPGYEPRPGDLGVYARAGEDPLLAGRGHTQAVVQHDGDRVLTIGGNEQNRIQVQWEPLRRESLRGWIVRT